MESHLNLALCSLEITQNQVKEQSKQIEQLTSKFKDQSQQLNDQSQQIERLVAKNTEQSQQLHNQSQQLNDQSQQIERLVAKNTEQSQQIAILEPLRSQPQYQAAMVDPTATKQTKDQTNKIGATNAYVKEGKFL